MFSFGFIFFYRPDMYFLTGILVYIFTCWNFFFFKSTRRLLMPSATYRFVNNYFQYMVTTRFHPSFLGLFDPTQY